MDVDANLKRSAASKDDSDTLPNAKRKKLTENSAAQIDDVNDSINESNEELDLNSSGQVT